MEKWDRIKEKHNMCDYDADSSYDTWTRLYLKVYPQIDVFRNNFDFDTPEESKGPKGIRLAIRMKTESLLEQIYYNELSIQGVPEMSGFKKVFYISGETDFNVKDLECHNIFNYSLMPVTGAMNNHKGGSLKDRYTRFIKELPQVVENPKNITGVYTSEVGPYKIKIAKSARRAYFSLFDNDVVKYCMDVYFFGVKESDGDIYLSAKRLLDRIKSYDDKLSERSIAEEYWNLRKEILCKKYGLEYQNEI